MLDMNHPLNDVKLGDTLIYQSDYLTFEEVIVTRLTKECIACDERVFFKSGQGSATPGIELGSIPQNMRPRVHVADMNTKALVPISKQIAVMNLISS